MKPAPFEYVAVTTVEEAVEALSDDGAQVLAGGQSLMPLINQRLARPRRLVDINPIPSILRRTDHTLHIGLTVRQATLERSPLIARHWPLLAQAVRNVGHAATRSRGTVCGSVAHDDPQAQLPLALQALDARHERNAALLVEITVPPLPHGAKTAFHEYARTRGEFPLAAAAVVLARDHAAVAVLGSGRVPDAEAALRDGATAEQAARLAGRTLADPHQRALATELTRRALTEAGRA